MKKKILYIIYLDEKNKFLVLKKQKKKVRINSTLKVKIIN
jgi:DNA-directed RNA polymerase subunit E'/Rpb7